MIVNDPGAFLDALARIDALPRAPATARAAFLVSPLDFSLARESAADNRYMDLDLPTDAGRALAEHAELARRIASDVPVVTFPGDAQAPDGIFPNNAFATTAGRLIVGRMCHSVRQRETGRSDIRAWFSQIMGYSIIDLSGDEHVAELTGALVIDRARGLGFCGLSERCDIAGARAMHAAFGLQLTYCFDLADGEYHTNVVLAVLAGRAAIVAGDGFANPEAAQAIARAYPDRALWIDVDQKRAFAANAITLTRDRVWMSARASASLSAEQHAQLTAFGFEIAAVELGEIEKGGGSLRCCIAEIF